MRDFLNMERLAKLARLKLKDHERKLVNVERVMVEICKPGDSKVARDFWFAMLWGQEQHGWGTWGIDPFEGFTEQEQKLVDTALEGLGLLKVKNKFALKD